MRVLNPPVLTCGRSPSGATGCRVLCGAGTQSSARVQPLSAFHLKQTLSPRVLRLAALTAAVAAAPAAAQNAGATGAVAARILAVHNAEGAAVGHPPLH